MQTRPFATCVLVLFLLLGRASIAHGDSTQDRVAFDATIRAELQEKAPSAVPTWDKANAARDANRFTEAETAYRDVIAAAPQFPHAHRRLCGVLQREERWTEAESSCRTALALDPSAIEEAALALALASRPGLPANLSIEAERHASTAVRLTPNDFDVVALAAEVAAARADWDTFATRVETLRRLDRDAPDTVALTIYSHLAAGDTDAARAELTHHGARLDADERTSLDSMIAKAEDQPSVGRWAYKALKIFGLWAAVFAFLYLAGSALSRLTLQAAEHVEHGAAGEARGATAWIRRAYAVLLVLTSGFFYVSLPLVALAVLAIAGGVIYGVLATGFVAPKLFFIILAITAASLWSIGKSLLAIFRRAPTEDPGIPLEAADHPKLHAVLDQVASAVGTRGPDRVFLTPGTTMAVFERGSTLHTMRGFGERCLVVGAGLLPGFRVGPFRAVLAHELGHFKNEDTAGGATSLAVRRSLDELVLGLARGGAAGRFNPAWLFAYGFHHVFFRISQGASRLQEVLADRWAVFAFGSANFVAGLKHVIRREIRFDAEVDHAVRSAVEGTAPLRSLYRRRGPVADKNAVGDAVREAIERPAGPFDSHPSPARRVEAAVELAVAVRALPDDDDDVWSLIGDRDSVDLALMTTVRENLRRFSNIHLPDTVDAPAPPVDAED